jgi:hypothetical protein
MATAVPLHALGAQTQAAGARRVSARPQGSEVAGAKEAVARVRRAKSLAELAACLTNESAATMGLALAAGVSMQVDFSSMGAAAPGASVQARRAKADLDALLRRYGLGRSSTRIVTMLEDPQALARFAPKGRPFLTDLDRVIRRLQSAGLVSGNLVRKAATPPAPQALTYRVLSPTRVAVRDPSKTRPSRMEARFEDGQWRVHLPLRNSGRSPSPR